MKSAESYKITYTHTIISNEQTLEAFLRPEIKKETSKVTRSI